MAADFREKAILEMEENTHAGDRMRATIEKVAVTNANMELVQYGALLKPLMDTMQEAVEVLQRRDASRVAHQATMDFKRSEMPEVRT